jgi:bisphosphoglycerate-dependent phosphoglycerate mutase
MMMKSNFHPSDADMTAGMTDVLPNSPSSSSISTNGMDIELQVADLKVLSIAGNPAAPTSVGICGGKVYFIRHGESTANEANVYSGVTDVPLTMFGIKQAQAAGADMHRKGIDHLDAVYTSHLVRTRKTAAVALNGAGLVPNDDPDAVKEWPTHLQPICMPSLAERSFGVFTGENKVLLRRALGHEDFENMVHSPSEAPPCAETIGSIYKRCQEFHEMEILPRLSRGETVLVVAHQYVLEAYALILEGLSPRDYYSFSLPNGKALSAEDMKNYRYKTTSKWQKRIDVIGDKTILHGTKIAAVLFTLGMIIRSLPSLWGQPITNMAFGPVFQATVTICLAVSSWFVYLEIDLSNAWANTPKLESKIVLAVYAFRVGLIAVGGLVLLQDSDIRDDMLESLEWWVLLFAVPPVSDRQMRQMGGPR